MFLITFIAAFTFLFMLFKTKSIKKSSIMYACILIVFLLLDYKVLINALSIVDYSKYVYLLLLIVLLNVIYWVFNRIIRTEIGYNLTNLLVSLFPINEMRYVALFVFSMFHISPFFLVNVLLLFLMSRLLNLSRLFSIFIILVGTTLSSFIYFLPSCNNPIMFNVFIISLFFVLALVFILIVLSTNYKQDYNLTTIFKDNYKILLATVGVFVMMLIFLIHQFPLAQVVNVSLFLSLACIVILSNSQKDKTKLENVEDINNKYPYLLSIGLIGINILILMLGSIFTDLNNNLLIIIQIVSLVAINGISFMLLDLPEINDNDQLPRHLTLANNGYLLLGIGLGLLIDLLVVMSNYNIGNFNHTIIQDFINNLNNAPHVVNLLLTTISGTPFITDPTQLLNLGLEQGINAQVIMFSSLILVITPLSLLTVSQLVNIKSKRLIEAYQFALIFVLIIIVILTIITVH